MILENPLQARYRTVAVRKGGMANVFLSESMVRDDKTPFPRRVAIKQIRPELGKSDYLSELFFREGLTSLGVGTHPNIIKTYSAHHRSKELPFFILEYGDLNFRDFLVGSRPDVSDLIACFIGLCYGLDYLSHRFKNFVHADIKPENIIVVGGIAKIADFGLASFKMVAAQKMNGPAGTPLYLAPEVCLGESPTMQSDIYSFGCVMFEAFLGNQLAGATTVSNINELKQLQAAGQLYPLTTLSRLKFPPLERVISSCLYRDPAGRYANFGEVASDLASILRHSYGKETVKPDAQEPTSIEFYNICNGLFNLGYFADTISRIESNPELTNGSDRNLFLILKAKANERYGNNEECLKILHEEIEVTTLSLFEGAYRNFELAKAYFRRNELIRAEHYARMATNITQPYPDANALHSAILFALERNTEALSAAAQAWEKSGRLNYGINYIQLMIIMETDDYRHAIAIAITLQKKYPSSFEPFLILADIYFAGLERGDHSQKDDDSLIPGMKQLLAEAKLRHAPEIEIKQRLEKLNRYDT
ncbi:serine/threonine protein kinase [Dyadobacter sp. BE34]|uniref:non-specific serine/threonine protein kinase n=1 Tax=Dyadobacter fermentans TaxID=94254 RepID=A0ABU1R9M3_9BACT|nr:MULTISPECIES: serine/threonine-protein kinase [Dyadobacter]MDR6809645.1 serine/threonine protein kinase [Dyadobacter fermentans]MDR7047323.1 serine/threonine protein kinase [Dyadobacter sp. BE242]MDR7201559.1 serine/threonine protein kinase [Dyadobacter sp. BE34]MDR7219429.1 serine/threonine protein kinase [Dyadobacter sp. BE31]MDR7267177.1 serine/threonine protein kinase [Dyadobacter sp. BE32]